MLHRAINDLGHGGIARFSDHPTLLRKNRSLYILRHFRGELSLGVSFWISYSGVLVFFTLLSELLVRIKGEVSLVTSSALILFFYVSISIVMPWFMVGTWRSASKYVEHGGKRIWSLSVKAVIVTGAYYLGKQFIFQTVPLFGVLVGIIAGDKETPAYQIIVYNGGDIIQFRGGLRAGAELDFKRKLESTTKARLLHIESDGGRVHEAIRIGRMIRGAGLATLVSTHCESAATLMFISGKERIVKRGAKIGFHRPSGKGSSDDADYENVRQFMKQAGISGAFINRVLATSHDNMWHPIYEEMLQAGVVTGELVDGKIYRSISKTEPDTPTASQK